MSRVGIETESRSVRVVTREKKAWGAIANGYRILSGVMKYFIIS